VGIPKPAAKPPSAEPQHIAAAYERAGRKAEAAALYEEIARTNSAARKVLSHRLVPLYAETGQTDEALKWAHEVMRDNPDPKAYLAGVHAQLGNWEQAGQMLQEEIAANTDETRSVTLRWQLADVLERLGKHEACVKVLDEASGLAKGSRMEAAALRRAEAAKTHTRKTNEASGSP
jgi:tetratricopeptide (TPR) repeat protein